MKHFAQTMETGVAIRAVYDTDKLPACIAAFRYRGYAITFTSEHGATSIVWREGKMIGLFENPETAIHKINRALDRARPLAEVLTEPQTLPESLD
ncbi:MAG: hypothetical protein JWR85_4221 [Marmoricola sp.]|nr:hypothetical protein [Marmoricola sp.]